MRTTVTLDEDVAARVREEMKRTGHSFKRALNNLIRRGSMPALAATLPAFEVKAREMRLPDGSSYDNVELLLDRLDGPSRR